MPFTTKTTTKATTGICASVAAVSLLIVCFIALMQWTDGFHRGDSSSSGHNLKGTRNGTEIPPTQIMANETNGTRFFTEDNTAMSSSICLVSLIDVEMDDEMKNEGGDDHEILVCHRVSSEYDYGVSDTIFYIENLGASTVLANQGAMMQNEWFIEVHHGWIQGGRRKTDTIYVPEYHQVQTIDPSEVPHHHSIDPSHRRQLTSKLDERKRKLFSTLGNRTVVIVSVDLTVPSSTLYDFAFGENNSLLTQMELCSQSQVRIIPHPTRPVIAVSPPQHPSQYSFVELYTTVLPSIKRKLGLRNGQAITSVTDHLFLVVPDYIDRRPGELGWGATPGSFAGIVESLSVSRSTMTMLHEIGHNFGLGHAYENHVAYSDMTTVMGYSHRNVVKMCYNGHNMWDMGWFPDRSYDIQLSDDKNDREVFDLAFYGDYNKTKWNQPVIARYGNAYFSFNRKRDMNIQTKEYADMLLVVQELPGEYHAHTNLEKALAVGNTPYQMKFNNQDKIFIEVCSYTAGNYLTPDVLTVAVARKQNNGCLGTQRDTGVGWEVATTQFSPQECAEEGRSWVEIADPQDRYTSRIELCHLMSKSQCTQTDALSKAEVWKICKHQCPQSGCT